MVSSMNRPWLKEGVTTVIRGQAGFPSSARAIGDFLPSTANRCGLVVAEGVQLMMGSAQSPHSSNSLTALTAPINAHTLPGYGRFRPLSRRRRSRAMPKCSTKGTYRARRRCAPSASRTYGSSNWNDRKMACRNGISDDRKH